MIYIGGYAAESNRGIYQLNDDLSLHHQICQDEGTSYFDIDDENIYTILKRNDKGGIAVFDHVGNEKSCALFEKKPGCFIQKHDDKIYCAYYHDACVQVLDLNLRVLYELHYPVGSKCHCIDFFKDKFAVVCLGLDQIFFYDYDFRFCHALAFPKGSGPRHMVHTQDEKELMVISELSNELFIIDAHTHSIIKSFSIKENDEPTAGAAIRLSRDERHLYTSTRGQDILKHFVFEDEWKEAQSVQLNGKLPRDFNLFDDFLVVGYQGSCLVEKIKLDENGYLTDQIEAIAYDKIVCVK